MARCNHERGNIQQFTEMCLDCGHNIYESDTEYEASLEQDIQRLQNEINKRESSSRIESKEKTKEALEAKLRQLKG